MAARARPEILAALLDDDLDGTELMEALRLAAASEGYLLDPVYTGKGLAGVRGLAQRGNLRPEETVVFWHTGGAPALFAFNDLV